MALVVAVNYGLVYACLDVRRHNLIALEAAMLASDGASSSQLYGDWVRKTEGMLSQD